MPSLVLVISFFVRLTNKQKHNLIHIQVSYSTPTYRVKASCYLRSVWKIEITFKSYLLPVVRVHRVHMFTLDRYLASRTKYGRNKPTSSQMKLCILSAMSLRRILPRNRKAEAHRSSLRLEIDRTPIHASNVTSTPTHNLSLAGRDSASVRLSDETKSSLTDRLVADPSYSKRSSGPGNFKYSPHFTGTFVCSILLVPDLC